MAREVIDRRATMSTSASVRNRNHSSIGDGMLVAAHMGLTSQPSRGSVSSLPRRSLRERVVSAIAPKRHAAALLMEHQMAAQGGTCEPKAELDSAPSHNVRFQRERSMVEEV